jgi:hypothetical protein
MDLIRFKSFLINHFLKIHFKSALENARNTQICTHPGLLVAGSGPPTPLVSVTERRGTFEELISAAVRPLATG